MKKKPNMGQKPYPKGKETYLALLSKHRVPFIILMSQTEADFKKAIETLYQNKRGIQPQGSQYSEEIMMKDYRIVKLTIEEL